MRLNQKPIFPMNKTHLPLEETLTIYVDTIKKLTEHKIYTIDDLCSKTREELSFILTDKEIYRINHRLIHIDRMLKWGRIELSFLNLVEAYGFSRKNLEVAKMKLIAITSEKLYRGLRLNHKDQINLCLNFPGLPKEEVAERYGIIKKCKDKDKPEHISVIFANRSRTRAA